MENKLLKHSAISSSLVKRSRVDVIDFIKVVDETGTNVVDLDYRQVIVMGGIGFNLVERSRLDKDILLRSRVPNTLVRNAIVEKTKVRRSKIEKEVLKNG